MAKTLKLTNLRVDPKSITVSFSEPVDMTAYTSSGSAPTSALNPTNYTISAQGATGQVPTSVLAIDDRNVALIPGPTLPLIPSEWLTVTAMNIAAADSNISPIPAAGEPLSRQVPSGTAQVTRDAEDAVAYPVLTEEVSFRPSPVGPPVGGGGSSAGGGAGLGQVAMRAVSEVLGWKPSTTDPKGFLGALTQSFSLTDIEGHVESKWVPHTFAVQTDLGGGITGAQASLYMRAKDALDQSLSLLDGLYPLDPDADPEYVSALREMARSQMNEIVKELGTVGLPSILRIDTYWEILLGQHPTRHFTRVEFDPDKIGGTLGQLRQTYGIYFRGNPWNNTVKDEEDITNFRVISDYMTSLMQSWIANREFFVVAPNQLAFFGTQLVLISRQLNVIAETVDEVRFTLDSVFIGPNERQTLLLEFSDRSLPPMFLEDMLVEIEKFVTDEGPRLLRDGGKISVTNNILPVVRTLHHLVKQAHDPQNRRKVPDGYRTVRVKRSLDDLQDQLRELARLIEQVEQQTPIPEYALALSAVSLNSFAYDATDAVYTAGVSLYGSGMEYGVEVSVHSSVLAGVDQTLSFVSAERVDVTLTFSPGDLSIGEHDITVRNPGSDGESATLLGAFSWGPDANTVASGGGVLIPGGTARSGATAPSAPQNLVAGPGIGVVKPASPPTAVSAPAPAQVPASASATDVSDLKSSVGQLQKSHAELQEGHKTLLQELRDMKETMVKYMEGKGKAGNE